MAMLSKLTRYAGPSNSLTTLPMHHYHVFRSRGFLDSASALQHMRQLNGKKTSPVSSGFTSGKAASAPAAYKKEGKYGNSCDIL